MSHDLAWKQRVLAEDKKLLAQVLDARRRLAESPVQASTTSTVRRANDMGSVSRRSGVAPPIGSSVRCSAGSSCAASTTPSIRSTATTQLSHHGVSTVQGTSISQLTVFSTRLEKLEQRLEEERLERKRVVDELSQIKQLLQQQMSQNRK